VHPADRPRTAISSAWKATDLGVLPVSAVMRKLRAYPVPPPLDDDAADEAPDDVACTSAQVAAMRHRLRASLFLQELWGLGDADDD
jgi:hypothetical protein